METNTNPNPKFKLSLLQILESHVVAAESSLNFHLFRPERGPIIALDISRVG